ncbi:PfkB family carbohydrate kinase [Planctomonas deserti]|uniref:PfkB family carbohydrate kinase n=1 Tax=Planctomonas deserti TaxID=2144185 RepID=UPI00197B61D8|nr:PfkB family carbohydrate kinase [Planctomonas deserti]
MAPRIVAVGDNVVDCYRKHAVMFPGGNCVNVAAYASRFGAESAYVGAVAADPAGTLLARSLGEEGVGLDRLRVVDGFTAYCVIDHEDGDRVFVQSELGVSRFAPDGEDLAFIGTFDAVHVGRSSGLDGHLRELAGVAALSYDFATTTDPDRIARIAPLCFLASFSGGGLSQAEADAVLRSASGAGARWTLVTRGADGALLSDGTTVHECPAAPATVVDTLGAGDTFAARVLVGLLRGESPAHLLAEAARAAAATCGIVGAFGHGVPVDVPAAALALS